LVNSGCKCPNIGNADAFKILGGQFEGPGPIRSFCGRTIGFRRLSGALDTVLIMLVLIIPGVVILKFDLQKI
jgi:hypothetical protein